MGELSEAVKLMKAEYAVRAIDEHKMDYGIIFCRTKVDCDNLEQYLNKMGGGKNSNQKYSCTVLHGDRKPDEKSNYVHRIGRVGRAERMGLAISLVATVPEKVWYHGQWCPPRGNNCPNPRLTHQKG